MHWCRASCTFGCRSGRDPLCERELGQNMNHHEEVAWKFPGIFYRRAMSFITVRDGRSCCFLPYVVRVLGRLSRLIPSRIHRSSPPVSRVTIDEMPRTTSHRLLQTDRKGMEIALAVKEVFEGAIMLHLYPRYRSERFQRTCMCADVQVAPLGTIKENQRIAWKGGIEREGEQDSRPNEFSSQFLIRTTLPS